jgi:hypothetical protein
VLPAGTPLARVYFSGSGHPVRWSEFRGFGPLNCRWDHHESTESGEAYEQERGVLYAAPSVVTSLAEMFQETRRIDRVYHAPWLVVFRTGAPLHLLDVTGPCADRAGAPPGLPLGSRLQSRRWARDRYEELQDLQGFVYSSAAGGGAPAVVLNERAFTGPLFPLHPDFHRALADDLLVDPLKHAAQELRYALR